MRGAVRLRLDIFGGNCKYKPLSYKVHFPLKALVIGQWKVPSSIQWHPISIAQVVYGGRPSIPTKDAFIYTCKHESNVNSILNNAKSESSMSLNHVYSIKFGINESKKVIFKNNVYSSMDC